MKKYYLAYLFGSSTLLIAIAVLVNVWIDLYGVFGFGSDPKKEVFYNEKVTKYLFSYKYIPSHFNGLLIGPSLSDNINTLAISDNKVSYYNASVMGANISELGLIVRNVIEKTDVKSVVICLHPYITKDHGSKGVQMNSSLYYESLGSLNLYQTYFVYLVRKFDLLPNKYPKGQFTYFGTNDYNELFKAPDIHAKIEYEVEVHQNEKIDVNELAIEELKRLVEELKNKDIDVLGYFHPYPEMILQSNVKEITQYQENVRRLFEESDPIIDFNASVYTSFREDLTNYIDHGHLSKQGSAFIENEISKKLANAKQMSAQ